MYAPLLLLLCDASCRLQEPVKLLNAMIEKAVIECVALRPDDFALTRCSTDTAPSTLPI